MQDVRLRLYQVYPPPVVALAPVWCNLSLVQVLSQRLLLPFAASLSLVQPSLTRRRKAQVVSGLSKAPCRDSTCCCFGPSLVQPVCGRDSTFCCFASFSRTCPLVQVLSERHIVIRLIRLISLGSDLSKALLGTPPFTALLPSAKRHVLWFRC